MLYEHVVREDRAVMARAMRRLYEYGLSTKEIAERYGRSYGSTHKMLREAGTQMRPAGSHR